MKKLFLSLSVVFALALASCGGGLESKKQKLAELEQEAVELAAKALQGEQVDEKKIQALADEIAQLEKEIAQLEKEEAEKAAQNDNDDED